MDKKNLGNNLDKENFRRDWLVMVGLLVSALILAIAAKSSPDGSNVWVLQIVLIALSFFSRRPWFPTVLAAVSTAAVIVVLFLINDATLSATVRYFAHGLGIVTFWTVAFIVRQFIVAKEILEEKDAETLIVSESLKVETWLRKGIAEINDAMRGVQSPEALCQNLLTRVSEYMGVKIGSFYLADDICFLRRAAVFAYADSGTGSQTFAANEGIIGQAAAQLKTFELNDVPADYYLRIKSSFGDVAPRHLAAVPVVFDGALRGVMELGSLRPFSAAARALLDIIPENIGIAVDLAVSRKRLQEALGKSQDFAEELQVKQVELKAANDEMVAQALALQESRIKLELQQTTVETSNAELEIRQTLLEEQKGALQVTNALLRSSKREIEVASQFKSEFLSNMSHELRTPLNSILILAQMLSENESEKLSSDDVQSALTIVSAGNDLLALINDILDLSKIESGKLDLDPEMVDLRTLMLRLERTFRPLAEKKGLTLNISSDPAEIISIYTDGQRLEQILNNFLSNAVKFTDKGTIGLHAQRTASGDRPVTIAVSDSGIGIPRNKQEVIFEAFKQADGTTSRRYGGTGLGLSISRELASLLQSEIGLESEENKGSTFTIFLPERLRLREQQIVEPEIIEPLHPLSSERQAPIRVIPAGPRSRRADFSDDRDSLSPDDRTLLAIEDDPQFAQTLANQIRARGFKCLLSEDGESGLTDAHRYLPSGIILDLKLPGLSGIEILERLKSDPKTRHIPVHVMSGMDHKKSALHLGAVGYLMKPVALEALQGAFSLIESVATRTLKRVLIVEDNETQLAAMRLLIAKIKDVEIIGAQSGAEALVVLRGASIDCMVLDLRLPDMSGLKLLETMAANNEFPNPPVIVYTGMELTRADEYALRRYTDSIIIKGARSPERVLDETILFLHRLETELPIDKQQILKDLRDLNQGFLGSRILVVDDDMRNIFALSRLLEEKGAIVTLARNGQEALDQLEKNPDHHLVLMDVMMPVMDGFEAIRRIRAEPRSARIPIIALTAKAMKGDQENCLAAGANDYLSKPIDIKRLVSLIHVWLAPQGH